MTHLTLLPDSERLVSAMLRQNDHVTDLVGQRVYTEMPNGTKTWPLVIVHRIGGSPVFRRPLWLDNATIGFAVYGGSKAMALQISETIRQVCYLQRGVVTQGDTPLGVVTDVAFGPLEYSPDVEDNGRPRYLFDIDFKLHPVRGA